MTYQSPFLSLVSKLCKIQMSQESRVDLTTFLHFMTNDLQKLTPLEAWVSMLF